MEQSEEYDGLLLKLSRNRQYLWGVSFQGTERNHLEKLIMDLQIMEPYENYILDRLKREGRGGTVQKTGPNVYRYEIEVFDCNEMLPWIRTFIGRILSLQCSSKSVEGNGCGRNLADKGRRLQTGHSRKTAPVSIAGERQQAIAAWFLAGLRQGIALCVSPIIMLSGKIFQYRKAEP